MRAHTALSPTADKTSGKARPGQMRPGVIGSLLIAVMQAGYGVVVCPNCKWPKGVALDTQHSRCGRCNRSLNLQRLRVWARTREVTQLPAAVGQVAERLQARIDPRELPTVEDLITAQPQARDLEATLDGVNRAKEARDSQTTLDLLTLALRAVAVSGSKSKWERTVTLVRELGRLEGDIAEALVEQGLARLGVLEQDEVDRAEPEVRDQLRQANEQALARWLKRLTEANVVYSPRAGIYRLV